MKKKLKKIFKPAKQLTIDEQIQRRNFISFFFFFAFIASGIRAWLWLIGRPLDGGIQGGIQQPLRDILNTNEKIFRKSFSNDHLVKSYPVSEAAKSVRVNGKVGLDNDFDASSSKLQVTRMNGESFEISLDEIKKLPKTEIIYNFKCIEGWNQVSWWAGVKFADFISRYGLEKETTLAYVGMSTPDEEYYVGIDMASALHPQTIICYEMNQQPLLPEHGAPLRLIIPVKYGVKSLKRIGTIFFANERPADYWAERGYDYYCGL